MKSDGYILTPELLQWRYFHRPVVVQVLIHLLLSSVHNEAGAVTLSYRDLALQLRTTVKTIRVAIDTLVADKIITKCSSPRASTIVYINSSHPLFHCIIPWRNDVRAQDRAQIGAHSRAQRRKPQTSVSQIVLVGQPPEKGTDGAQQRAQTRAQQKTGAQATAQIGAQINTPETPLNKGDSEDSAAIRGTSKGTDKGTLARKGKKETKETKESLSPEPPNKEKKERKERRQKSPLPLSQKKEKEKKSGQDEKQMAEVIRLFNRIFIGTPVKTVSKLTPERKRMVAKFIADYSFEDIEPLMRRANDSDLLMGREDGRCSVSFNWLFTPEKYEQLMEGTFDNPTIQASASKKSTPKQPSPPAPSPPQPQHEETSEEIEARLQKKEEAKQAKEKAETEALRQKYLSYIEYAAKDPNGSMARMLKQAYENGKLAELGIVWNPSVAEEEQSLADLDDQTQKYLKSILGD
ncbi:MAG: hypothetical protein EGR07_03235 [Prevotella sp.]|nr:hypothetical protein [Prevotella sp.]